MLKAVKKKRAYEDIVKQIRHLIEKGRLKRGDQLPTERELSETFKVSRATVREAIFSLETMKLVERRQGNGTYVIASSEEALVQPLAASLFHEKDDLIDIFSSAKSSNRRLPNWPRKTQRPKKSMSWRRSSRSRKRSGPRERTPCRWIPNFIISWPGWPKTGFWNACLLALLTFWARPAKDTFRPRRENKNRFWVIRKSSPPSRTETGRQPGRPCAGT